MTIENEENTSNIKIEHSKEPLHKIISSSRNFKSGDIILKSAPLLVGPKTTKIDKGKFPCVGCLKLLSTQNYEHCLSCNWPCCSKTCQGLTDQNFHGFECQILKLRPSDLLRKGFFDYFRFDVLSIIRALSLLKLDKTKWDALMTMEDHLDVRGVPNSVPFRQITEKVLHLQVNYLKPWKDLEEKLGEAYLPQFLSDVVHRLYGILETNCIIFDYDDKECIVLYPKEISWIEHSCMPNTVEDININETYSLKLRALKSIDIDEHITRNHLSKAMTLWGSHQRRKYLKEQRYISCNCSRCEDPSEFDTNLSALKCLGTERIQCGGCQLPEKPLIDNSEWICNKCQLKLPQKKLIDLVVYINKEVDKQLERSDITLEDLEDFLGKLLFFLHRNHYLVHIIKFKILEMCDNSEINEETLTKEILHERMTMVEEMVDVVKKIDPQRGRLSEYLIELYMKQFSIKLKFLHKTFDKNEKQSSMFLIEEILTILDNSKQILKSLQNSQKMHEKVTQNELKISNWIQENNIKL